MSLVPPEWRSIIETVKDLYPFILITWIGVQVLFILETRKLIKLPKGK